MSEYSYYKFYLKRFDYRYEDYIPFNTLEQILEAIPKYYNDYAGCLIIGRVNSEDRDDIIFSRDFNNERTLNNRRDLAQEFSSRKR